MVTPSGCCVVETINWMDQSVTSSAHDLRRSRNEPAIWSTAVHKYALVTSYIVMKQTNVPNVINNIFYIAIIHGIACNIGIMSFL